MLLDDHASCFSIFPFELELITGVPASMFGTYMICVFIMLNEA
jgi:hypothetical protein